MTSLPQIFQVEVLFLSVCFHQSVWVVPNMDGVRPRAWVLRASNCASTGCCTK